LPFEGIRSSSLTSSASAASRSLFAYDPEDLIEKVEAWASDQEPPLSRSEAIRALIERGLGDKAKRR